jgi:hypothetical protein
MAVHYHYMNGTSGCMPDTSEVYRRKKDAIWFAESLFDTLCEKCFKAMSKELRQRTPYAHHYFDTDCENDNESGGQCSSGADYVEISQAHSRLTQTSDEGLVCQC